MAVDDRPISRQLDCLVAMDDAGGNEFLMYGWRGDLWLHIDMRPVAKRVWERLLDLGDLDINEKTRTSFGVEIYITEQGMARIEKETP